MTLLHKAMTSFDKPLTLLDKAMTSFDQPMTSKDQPVTSLDQAAITKDKPMPTLNAFMPLCRLASTACRVVAACAMLTLAPAAHAQWTVTNLHPAGAVQSVAEAVSGGDQVGHAPVGGVRRASLWSGSAASWVDLNPAGSTNSEAFASSSGQQAGIATVGRVTRASLWRGTAASWVDLHPAGTTASSVYATSDGLQAGSAYVGGREHASLWNGTAASWVDLHAILPTGFVDSRANGISSDGLNLSIVGTGLNTLTGRYEALLWTRPLPPPLCPADFNRDNTIDFFDYSDFVECFETEVCGGGGGTADFNGDSFVDFFDYADFVEAFEAEC